jgi:hypothetical protein
MIRYTDDKDVRHIMFDSLSDFFKNTDVKNPPSTMNPNNRSEHRDVLSRGDTSWRYGDEGNIETFHEVRFDPEKGRKMCADHVKKTMADKAYKSLIKQALTYRKRIKFEDHGFRINVPKALSGEDRYFGVYKNSRKPIVKIAINICGSASVDQAAFRKVAQTAVPTIYALETAGISTEVYYTAFAQGTHNDTTYTATHVKIKSSQQRFNWTTFAPVFCLGSYRESVFLSWIYDDLDVDGGLGRPLEDRKIKQLNNLGYTAVIGLNAVGPVDQVSEIFEKIGKKGS